MAPLLQVLADGVSLGLIYALSALGFALIFKSNNTLNFAHGGLMAAGGFLFMILAVGAGLPEALAFPLALTGGLALGLLLERFFVRTPPGRTFVHRTILILGLALMFKGMLSSIFGGAVYTLPEFLPDWLSLNMKDIHIPPERIFICMTAAAFIVLFALFYRYSIQGIYMRAVFESKQTALSLGIRAEKGAALSWAIMGLICAMTGILFGLTGGISVSSLNAAGLKVVAVMVIGGLGSMWGAVLAGLFIGFLEAFTGAYISSTLGNIVPYILLLFMVAVRPGSPAKARENKMGAKAEGLE